MVDHVHFIPKLRHDGFIMFKKQDFIYMTSCECIEKGES